MVRDIVTVMATANLTVSLPEPVLDRFRAVARARNTTPSALAADLIRRASMVEGAREYAAWEAESAGEMAAWDQAMAADNRLTGAEW